MYYNFIFFIARLPTAPKKNVLMLFFFSSERNGMSKRVGEFVETALLESLCASDRDGDSHIRFMLFSRLFHPILKAKSVVCEIPVR